jgi:hypothetical protein
MIRETYAPSILKAKAAKMRKETGDDRYWCRYDEHMGCKNAMSRSFSSVLTNYSGTTFQSELVTSFHTILYRTHFMVLECLYRGMFVLAIKHTTYWRTNSRINRLSMAYCIFASLRKFPLQSIIYFHCANP